MHKWNSYIFHFLGKHSLNCFQALAHLPITCSTVSDGKLGEGLEMRLGKTYYLFPTLLMLPSPPGRSLSETSPVSTSTEALALKMELSEAKVWFIV